METEILVQPVKPTELTLPEREKSFRIPELDGIRGIAILMVLAFHFLNYPLSNDTTGSAIVKVLKALTTYGWAGVDLFFVLSGFLIGGILIEHRKSSNYFKTFYLRRVLRIVPPYFLLLIAFFTLDFLIGDKKYFTFEGNLPVWSYFTFTQNFFMGLHQTFGSEGVTPTWSLAVEEQFYLLSPLLIWIVKPKYLPAFLVTIIAFAVVFRSFSNFYQSYTWFHCRMDSLATGVLLAWLYHYKLDRLKKIKLNSYYIAVISMILIFGAITYKLNNLQMVRYTLFAILFAVIILIPLVHSQSLPGKILRNGLLIRIGLISYSLYLFHELILGVFHQVILDNHAPQLNTAADLIVSFLALAVSLLFAVASYRWIERPAMRYGRRFKY